MHIEILHDVPVSPNYGRKEKTLTCSYPLTTVRQDGTVVCVYRQGAKKHSHDGVLVAQASVDLGRAWSDPEIVYDGTSENRTVSMGAACETPSRNLLAVCGTIEGLRPEVYMFDEEAEKLPLRVFVRRQTEGSSEWSEPEVLEPGILEKADPSAKPFVLPDGSVFVPLEFKAANGCLGTGAVISRDNGRSFGEPFVCVLDSSGKENWCDARFAVLHDGRILMMLWTFIQENEQTIELHRCYSSDLGRTWSKPESTGFTGQVTAPIETASGTVIAASNYRQSPEGIRLWYSYDAGLSWDCDRPLQMWDATQARMLGTPVERSEAPKDNDGVWKALAGFQFGTPDLVKLKDGSVLLTYYATLDEVSHIRACRFDPAVR